METHPATTGRPETAMEAAKRPVTELAGPYGHPFHPILVTVPIGAWVVAFVFDLISRTTPTGGRDLTFLGQLLAGPGEGGAMPNPFAGASDGNPY